MSIVGGALMPLVAGALFKNGAVYALIVPLVCFTYVTFFALSGYRITKADLSGPNAPAELAP